MQTISIGSKSFDVYPLTLGALRKLAEAGHLTHLAKLDGGHLTADQLNAVSAVVSLCLQRVDKDITAQWVEDNLEFKDIGPVLQTILKVSGFLDGASGPNVGSP